VFGLSIGISFILLLVAGIVSKNWLGMIMIVPLIMVPISMIVVEALGGGSAGSGKQGEVQEMSTPSLVFLLLHRHRIVYSSCKLRTVFLWVSSLLLIWPSRYATVNLLQPL